MKVIYEEDGFMLIPEGDFEESWLEEKFYERRNEPIVMPKRKTGVSPGDFVGYKFVIIPPVKGEPMIKPEKGE